LIIFGVMVKKQKKNKNFENSLNDLKYSNVIKEFNAFNTVILINFVNFLTIYRTLTFLICQFSHLLFHKIFNFQIRVLKLTYNLNNVIFYLWFKNFQNLFTQFWFKDVFTSLFCYNVFQTLTFFKTWLKFLNFIWMYKVKTF